MWISVYVDDIMFGADGNKFVIFKELSQLRQKLSSLFFSIFFYLTFLPPGFVVSIKDIMDYFQVLSSPYYTAFNRVCGYFSVEK